MKDFDQIEYEQLSQDWRHRDVLTWRFPSFLILVEGILVAQAFRLSAEHPWIQSVLLGLGAGLAICLTVALRQNLKLQENNADSIEKRLGKDEETTRFAFCPLGSYLLLGFCVIVSIVLIGLFVASLCGVFDVPPLPPGGPSSVDPVAID